MSHTERERGGEGSLDCMEAGKIWEDLEKYKQNTLF